MRGRGGARADREEIACSRSRGFMKTLGRGCSAEDWEHSALKPRAGTVLCLSNDAKEFDVRHVPHVLGGTRRERNRMMPVQRWPARQREHFYI